MYWLNENSRKFLSKGYLVGDITAEERIREIAEIAEKHLGKPGFADKFYDYMSRGFYSPCFSYLVQLRTGARVADQLFWQLCRRRHVPHSLYSC